MPYPHTHLFYSGILCGYAVRKQLAQTYIFRVRRGNGFYGSDPNIRYQDRYVYVVPGSISNPQGASSRAAMTQAVINWQTTVSDAEKAEWRLKAVRKQKTTGYALYVGDYISRNA